jgi:hypothetical protein
LADWIDLVGFGQGKTFPKLVKTGQQKKAPINSKASAKNEGRRILGK